MRKGKERGARASLGAVKPQESSNIKFNFYTLGEQARRQSPGRRPTSQTAKPRGSAAPAPARTGFRVEMVAGKRAPAGACSAGRRRAPSARLGPALALRAQLGAAAPRARRAPPSREHARRPEPPAGPAPVSRLIRRFVPARAARRRPRPRLRGRADSPLPPLGLRACESGQPPTRRPPGFIQAGPSRRRSEDSPCPRSRRRRRRHGPKRAEVRRRKPWTQKRTQFPASFSYPKILDEMRHDHRAAAAAPGSASAPARRCVNTGPAPTAPPPFSATAFFPEPSPHPPGRMRHLAAAADAGPTPGRSCQGAHAPRVPFPGFSPLV